ncbi:hypothetical protein C7M84_016259 [Penaeus vannamei]|uniref:Uncharacterized protein n=1 Tax=Penaeus vannamei TaxID=6689 RepID=A0A3R7M2U9_PENVA|nr:hypothetical protein C7M84_016259 [Penaeus vannamei]
MPWEMPLIQQLGSFALLYVTQGQCHVPRGAMRRLGFHQWHFDGRYPASFRSEITADDTDNDPDGVLRLDPEGASGRTKVRGPSLAPSVLPAAAEALKFWPSETHVCRNTSGPQQRRPEAQQEPGRQLPGAAEARSRLMTSGILLVTCAGGAGGSQSASGSPTANPAQDMPTHTRGINHARPYMRSALAKNSPIPPILNTQEPTPPPPHPTPSPPPPTLPHTYPPPQQPLCNNARTPSLSCNDWPSTETTPPPNPFPPHPPPLLESGYSKRPRITDSTGTSPDYRLHVGTPPDLQTPRGTPPDYRTLHGNAPDLQTPREAPDTDSTGTPPDYRLHGNARINSPTDGTPPITDHRTPRNRLHRITDSTRNAPGLQTHGKRPRIQTPRNAPGLPDSTGTPPDYRLHGKRPRIKQGNAPGSTDYRTAPRDYRLHGTPPDYRLHGNAPGLQTPRNPPRIQTSQERPGFTDSRTPGLRSTERPGLRLHGTAPDYRLPGNPPDYRLHCGSPRYRLTGTPRITDSTGNAPGLQTFHGTAPGITDSNGNAPGLQDSTGNRPGLQTFHRKRPGLQTPRERPRITDSTGTPPDYRLHRNAPGLQTPRERPRITDSTGTPPDYRLPGNAPGLQTHGNAPGLQTSQERPRITDSTGTRPRLQTPQGNAPDSTRPRNYRPLGTPRITDSTGTPPDYRLSTGTPRITDSTGTPRITGSPHGTPRDYRLSTGNAPGFSTGRPDSDSPRGNARGLQDFPQGTTARIKIHRNAPPDYRLHRNAPGFYRDSTGTPPDYQTSPRGTPRITDSPQGTPAYRLSRERPRERAGTEGQSELSDTANSGQETSPAINK